VYNNWSSYDELSDNVLLTEELAMKELDEIIRLRRLGVRFDYYMMDAFWFAQMESHGGWHRLRPTTSGSSSSDRFRARLRMTSGQ